VTITRRQALKTLGGAAAIAATTPLTSFAKGADDIVIGSLHDLSGAWTFWASLWKTPCNWRCRKSTAPAFARQTGTGGQPWTRQSNMQLYAQYAQPDGAQG